MVAKIKNLLALAIAIFLVSVLLAKNAGLIKKEGSSCDGNMSAEKKLTVKEFMDSFCNSGVAACKSRDLNGKSFWYATAWLYGEPDESALDRYLRTEGWEREPSRPGHVYRKSIYQASFGMESSQSYMGFSAHYCD